MKDLKPGSRWSRQREGTLLEEHITITAFSRSSDTSRCVFIQYRTDEDLTGTFYGLLESWHCQFSPVPSD
jgi:hypothetical protein